MPYTKDPDRTGDQNEAALVELRDRIRWARLDRHNPHGTAVAVRIDDCPLAFGFFAIEEGEPLRALGGHIVLAGRLEWRLRVEGHDDTHRQMVGVRFGDVDQQAFEGRAGSVRSEIVRDGRSGNSEVWATLIGAGPLTWRRDTPDQ